MSKKRASYRIYWYIIGLTVAIVACYFIVVTDNQFFRTEPTAISEVGDFSFINQDGIVCNQSILDDKLALVYFFFTNCQNVCPLIYQSVEKILTPFKNQENLVVLAHTCDPDRDDVARLKAYALEHQNIDTKFIFLTGEKKALYEAARFYYKIDDPQRPADKDFNFMHTQYIALVDNHKVIMIVDGLKEKELKYAQEKIKSLLNKRGYQEN